MINTLINTLLFSHNAVYGRLYLQNSTRLKNQNSILKILGVKRFNSGEQKRIFLLIFSSNNNNVSLSTKIWKLNNLQSSKSKIFLYKTRNINYPTTNGIKIAFKDQEMKPIYS